MASIAGIIVRESAIFGILGVATLGYSVDDAISILAARLASKM